MKRVHRVTTLFAALAAIAATQAAAEVIFYEHEGFQGRSFNADRPIGNLERSGFNDRASSAVVLSDRWEVCEHAQFGGRCVVLRPGRYASLAAMGMNDRVSSLRIVSKNARVDDYRYAPGPAMPVYDNRRRNGERIYEADVTAVRAVVNTPEQRCWVEREQVRDDRNVGGAVVGALLGGVLGHQVGSGRGNDVATVVGALGGAAIGSNVGRDRDGRTQDVQRCTNVSGTGRPDYYDVTYNFRGQDHRVQMTTPPGPTVSVNARGEPRA